MRMWKKWWSVRKRLRKSCMSTNRLCLFIYAMHVFTHSHTHTHTHTHTSTQVMVDKVVEKPKIVYVDVPKYTDKVVQKFVEKFVEVPVEKIVYQVGGWHS